jgi:Na+-transporting methylmalonyl-CoA/oxaloacetate decarboxylase gamma subunit
MDNWTFGLTLLVVGMGGTLVALGLLAVMMNLLKKIFPVKKEEAN